MTTVDEFDADVKEWIATAKRSDAGKRLTPK